MTVGRCMLTSRPSTWSFVGSFGTSVYTTDRDVNTVSAHGSSWLIWKRLCDVRRLTLTSALAELGVCFIVLFDVAQLLAETAVEGV